MTIPLITTPDGFEYVRNAIANIIATESANQVAAAVAWNLANPTEEQLVTSEWAIDVYTERSNAFELFRGDENESVQVVNVWYESSDVDKGKSTNAKQWTISRINVDCLACAVSEETSTGHIPADETAFLRAQKVARLCRRVLMHPDYKLLGLKTYVGGRYMSSRRVSPPTANTVPGKHVEAVQLQFEVHHSEFIDFAELTASEGALIKIYREPDGQVMAQMDYDWT